ncbi:MAG: hypothetical protein M1839_002130 [Geoglossum umbratile]|nr:MAG: hypothetical protein M1839_002130 [Geoglossum umbratile]
MVEPKILLERFIKTVEGECKEAENAGQDVLLLVFGHGDSETYGVTIGSASNIEFREMTAPRLQISRWAMNPDLNLTVIAAAGHAAKSQSWNASLARGFSGSVIASAILDAILASEVEDGESLGKSGMTYQELRTTETYAEMSCLIHDHLKQNDRFHDHHAISFAAQDDKWTEAWRERTGIPMAFFKERWEELSVLPAQADGFSNRDPSSIFTGSFALGSLSETRSGSAIRLTHTKTMPQIYTMVRALAAGYAKSFPGMDNVSINTTLHTNVRLLLGGEGKYEDRMDGLLTLGYTLSYRLEGMTMATNYKDFLGLDYPDCDSCCIEAWTFPLYESKEKEAKEKLAKYAEVKRMIKAAKIFSTAADGQGYDYDKPEEYLAIAFVESGKSKNEVEQTIAVLKGLHTTLITPKVQEVRRGRWFVDKANQILKPVKKTLRSMSPQDFLAIIQKYENDIRNAINENKHLEPNLDPPTACKDVEDEYTENHHEKAMRDYSADKVRAYKPIIFRFNGGECTSIPELIVVAIVPLLAVSSMRARVRLPGDPGEMQLQTGSVVCFATGPKGEYPETLGDEEVAYIFFYYKAKA